MDELAITCSKDSVSVWQLRSGSVIQSYRNNVSLIFTVCGNHSILCPQENKPYLHSYLLNKESVQWKAPLSEKLISIACSADGRYCCAGGSSGNAYLWDVYTGELRSQWQANFNEVLGISFLGSSSELLVTSGKDSMVHCWTLGQILTQKNDVKPFRSWSGHSLPVTSIHCTNSRIISSSLDHTCKIWSMTSSDPISSIIFPSAITSMTMDSSESMLFAGSNDGKIYAVNLLNSSINIGEQVFIGHTKPVTSLSTSIDGTILLSTSIDGTSKVWDTKSFQLIRNLTHHVGPVTFCKIGLFPRCLFEDNTMKTIQEPNPMFKKYSSQADIKVAQPSTILPIDISYDNNNSNLQGSITKGVDLQEELQVMQMKVEALEQQIIRWNSVGKKLFKLQIGASE